MADVCMKNGTEMEVSSKVKGFEGAWFRAVLEANPRRYGKKMKKYTFRYLDLTNEDKSPLYENTSKRYIRPVPPENLFSRGKFEEGSFVEANHRDGWWVGLFLRKVEEDKYLIYFESPSDLLCFRRKQLRQHFHWTDGKWVRPQNKQPSQFNWGLSCGSEVEVLEERGDLQWFKAMIIKEMQDGKTFLVKDCRYLTWNDENKPQRTVHLSKIRNLPNPQESTESLIAATSTKQTGNTVQGMASYTKTPEPVRNQNGLGNESIGKKESQALGNKVDSSEMMNAKEAVTPATPIRMQDGSGNSSTLENEASLDKSHKRKAQENISEDPRAKKTPMALPFEKKLPVWKVLEAMEVFKEVPQTPHFSPLMKTQEDSRETSAVGMMFTYSTVLEEIKTLQLVTPTSTFNGLNVSFAMLEKHGFDVKAPQSQIQKLLSLKDKQAKKVEECKRLERGIVMSEKGKVENKRKFLELQKLDEDYDKIIDKMKRGIVMSEKGKVENKRKFLELQRIDEEYDKIIDKMKSSAASVDQELEDVELQFQSTTSRSPQK